MNTNHIKEIREKIEMKQRQIDIINRNCGSGPFLFDRGCGPVLLAVVGLIVCMTIVGIILGLIIIMLAFCWEYSRNNEQTKLKNEIDELEAELEEEVNK